MNKTILIGNVGKDPEVKYKEGGTKWASFSLATSESYRNKAGEDHKYNMAQHNSVGNVVDVIQKYVHKGDKVMVDGKINNRSY